MYQKSFYDLTIIHVTLSPANHLSDMISYSEDVVLSMQETKEESFYLVNLNRVRQSIKTWRTHFPKIRPYYAVKCNPDIQTIELLSKSSVNFDCASPSEIDLVLNARVDPSRILYANPFKRACDIEYAYKKGVKFTTFDTVDELKKIMKTCPDMKVILRIYANDPTARCCLSNKFGAHPHDWKHLLHTAKILGADLAGISFHVGSAAASVDAFTNALMAVKEIINLSQTMGFDPTIIDIGGGFQKNTISEFSPYICDALKEHFDESKYQWIAEPGRFFAEDSATLYTKVIGIRENPDETRNYILTDGLYGSFNCILYDHISVLPLTMSIKSTETWKSSTLYGPTCDGFDCIAKNVLLPKLEIGDYVYFENMGAYTASGACDFNGIKFTKIKKFYI